MKPEEDLSFPGTVFEPCAGGCGWDVPLPKGDPRHGSGKVFCSACESSIPCHFCGQNIDRSERGQMILWKIDDTTAAAVHGECARKKRAN